MAHMSNALSISALRVQFPLKLWFMCPNLWRETIVKANHSLGCSKTKLEIAMLLKVSRSTLQLWNPFQSQMSWNYLRARSGTGLSQASPMDPSWSSHLYSLSALSAGLLKAFPSLVNRGYQGWGWKWPVTTMSEQ